MSLFFELRAFLSKVSNAVMFPMKTFAAHLSMALAFALCGCSTFNYEWRQAAAHPVPTNGITGQWQGRWMSNANGHEDSLRCIITKVDEDNYDAKFRAAYKKWITFHFGYTVRLETKNAATRITFHGREDLGPLAGGVYTYEGYADPTNFFSTYKSKYDQGTFQMNRPTGRRTIPVYSTPERR